jgi:hypothetical protein
MAYNLTFSDSRKIIFDRAGAGCASSMFMVIGAVFFLIGLGINYFAASWEFPFLLFRLLFPLFGGGAMVMGFYIPRMARQSTPQRITFDHDLGTVIIDMTVPSSDIGYIRYDEIQGFEVYVEARRSSSSGSRTMSSTHYYYHVLLRKKDGGSWAITEASSNEKAEEIKNQLTAQVNLNKPFTARAVTKLSTKIGKQEGADKTIIHWQNKVAWWTPIFLLVFSVVFISILAAVFSFDLGDLGFLGYAIAGFMLLIFGFVMFTAVRNLIKEASTRYAIAVGRDHVEYYEFSKSSGVVKNTRTIPLQDVRNITYSFGETGVYGQGGLSILTKRDLEQMERNKVKPMEAIKDFFSGKDKPINLAIAALNPVECLQLETWLQELVKSKGNAQVI